MRRTPHPFKKQVRKSRPPAWVSYFQDSLKRCAVIRDELDRRPEIYDPSLIAQYRGWQRSQKSKS